jgi:hypothetical protein
MVSLLAASAVDNSGGNESGCTETGRGRELSFCWIPAVEYAMDAVDAISMIGLTMVFAQA